MKRIACFLLLILGCSVKPKPIAYGETACHYCSMTIVDKQHAAQLVTTKGKVFNFDALECMANHLNKVETQEIGLLLTNTYYHPEALINVTESTFLISEGIPSPMGEFLTAFQTAESAEAAQKQHGGSLYDWESLQAKFKK